MWFSTDLWIRTKNDHFTFLSNEIWTWARSWLVGVLYMTNGHWWIIQYSKIYGLLIKLTHLLDYWWSFKYCLVYFFSFCRSKQTGISVHHAKRTRPSYASDLQICKNKQEFCDFCASYRFGHIFMLVISQMHFDLSLLFVWEWHFWKKVQGLDPPKPPPLPCTCLVHTMTKKCTVCGRVHLNCGHLHNLRRHCIISKSVYLLPY